MSAPPRDCVSAFGLLAGFDHFGLLAGVPIMKLSRFAVVCGVAAGSLLATQANAALILNLNGAINVADNGPGDLNPAVGQITNQSIVAGFGIAISVAASNSPGTPTAGLLQISSLLIENQAAGTGVLTITTSDTDYVLPVGPFMTLDSDIGGTFSIGSAVGNSVTFESFADPNNGQPANAVSTPLLAFVKATSATTESFSGSTSANWFKGGPFYSLANRAVVTLAAGGQVNLSGTTTAVPEPTSALALAAMSAGLLGLRRRSR